ncbi:MAG TPA: Uma2 family endonuclease [Polyangiaceae bacterium]|nr:Uma2 family endonuclease [Polyangiaceae bacterium]
MVVVQPKPTSSAPQRRYLRAPVPVHFPTEQTVPESRLHLRLRTALWSMLQLALKGRAVVGSEQFVYWDPTDPKQCVAPDILVRFGEPDQDFASWKVWERGAPHLAIEVISEHDAPELVWEGKLAAFQRSGVVELVRFDPADAAHPLRLWDRVEGDLVEREVSKHVLERSDVLDLYWCVESSSEFRSMLRLCRDPAGLERLLTEGEALELEAQGRRTEAEGRRAAEARADAVEARLRELEAELARLTAR